MTMADEERIYVHRIKPVLSREQKTAFGFVLSFGALALIFGTFYLWKHVASPFALSYTGPKFLTGNEQQQQEMDRLKSEDTDDDGLSDYDELYVYRTSPYLKDSDGDVIEDATEVAQGQDPNCAPQMPCASTVDAVNPTDLRASFLGEIALDADASMDAGGADPAPVDVVAALAGMTTEEIRAFLIDAGGDAAAINALSDEQIRAALAAAVTDLDAEGAFDSGTTTDTTVTPSAENSNSTP